MLAALQSLPSVDGQFSSADLQKPKVQIQLKHLNYYADLLTPDLQILTLPRSGRAPALAGSTRSRSALPPVST